MIQPGIVAEVRDAVQRAISGRARVPGDLPYPPSINGYACASAWPDRDPAQTALTPEGHALGRAARQIYVAGYLAGRTCDAQIADQVRAALGLPEDASTVDHPYVGLAVCLLCDQAPGSPRHGAGADAPLDTRADKYGPKAES